MGTKVLPQALFTIPSNPSQPPSKQLVFCTTFCTRISNSRVSINSRGFNLKPIFKTAPPKRPFLVRAESSDDGEPETAADADENVDEEAVVAGADDTGAAGDEAEEPKPKPPRKPRIKLGEIMGILNKRAIEASEKVRPVPDIRTGDIVEIKLEVPENRRRLSIYKGIVISKQNAGIHTTIRIRRIVAGVGVEIVFPVYSPNIKEIKVVSHRKVRRARLYYLRDKLPKFSTFK